MADPSCNSRSSCLSLGDWHVLPKESSNEVLCVGAPDSPYWTQASEWPLCDRALTAYSPSTATIEKPFISIRPPTFYNGGRGDWSCNAGEELYALSGNRFVRVNSLECNAATRKWEWDIGSGVVPAPPTELSCNVPMGIYCPKNPTTYSTIGSPLTAANEAACQRLCDKNRVSCTAINFNAKALKCTLLQSCTSTGCIKPTPILTRLEDDYAPACKTIPGTERIVELDGICYYTIGDWTVTPYETLTTRNDVCACLSGRRTSMLAVFLNATTQTKVRAMGLTPSGFYLIGARQIPPNLDRQACHMGANPSAHCLNWFWMEWDGTKIGPIPTSQYGELGNSAPHENAAGMWPDRDGIMDCDSSQFIAKTVCQFEI